METFLLTLHASSALADRNGRSGVFCESQARNNGTKTFPTIICEVTSEIVFGNISRRILGFAGTDGVDPRDAVLSRHWVVLKYAGASEMIEVCGEEKVRKDLLGHGIHHS